MARHEQVKTAVIQTSTLGDNTIVAAVTGKKIRVLSYVVTAVTANNVKWKSGASTDKTGLHYLAANGGVAAAPHGPESSPDGSFWLETAAGEALVLNLSAATAVGGVVAYQEV